MVEMRDVSVVYSGGVDALHNVNLKINDGDFAFVVGPSGAGKSTMIKQRYGFRQRLPSRKTEAAASAGTAADDWVCLSGFPSDSVHDGV